MKYIAFDLETTGIVPGVDHIVEIGAVCFSNGVVDSIYSTLIDPQIPIPKESTAINGITNEMVSGKPKIEDILPSFVEFCGSSVMVAHNAPFDFQFLVSELKKYDLETPSGVVLDTLPLSRKLIPGLINYKLGTLVNHFNIKATGDFHRAEQDANYCGQVFLELLKKMGTNLRVDAFQVPVENLVTLTGKAEVRFPKITRSPKQMGFLF